jgi:hypothetical protein
MRYRLRIANRQRRPNKTISNTRIILLKTTEDGESVAFLNSDGERVEEFIEEGESGASRGESKECFGDQRK